MEKICIARRRTSSAGGQRVAVRPEIPAASPRTEQPEEVLSVALSAGQCRQLQANGIFGQISGSGTGPVLFPDGKVVFNFHMKKMEPIRMLKPEHVRLMLQIGKGSLSGLVRNGELKSYKIGKLRRFLLADVVDYLDRCVETPESMQPGKGDPGSSSRGRADEREQTGDPGVVGIQFGD